jgi:hypothetical protein
MARLARLCVLLLVASAVAASTASADPTKFVVNTLDDVQAADVTADMAISACSPDIDSVGAIENLVYRELNEVEAGNDQDVQDVRLVPCSFRMALIAANANEPVTDPKLGDEIVFDRAVFVDSGSDAVVRFGQAPLPPIVDPYLTIDGCDRAPPTDLGPCVDVEFANLAAGSSTIAGVPGSALPPNPNGLIVLAQEVAITGLAFHNGNPAIWHPPATNVSATTGTNSSLSVTNSFFGLDTSGTPTDPPQGTTGILLSSDHARIGLDPSDTDPQRPLRNVFAQGQTGILIAGASDSRIEGNWFGTGPDGKAIDADEHAPLETGVKVTGLGVDATVLADQLAALEALSGVEDDVRENPLLDDSLFATLPAVPDVSAQEQAETLGHQTLATGNRIGASAAGAAAASAACDGPCNLFLALSRHAIDVGGSSLARPGGLSADSNGEPAGAVNTEIAGNQFGVADDGTAAGTERSAIIVQNGSTGTAVGGEVNGEINVISNSAEAGVAVMPGAGNETTFGRNRGVGNGDGIFDLGGDGPGNAATGPNGGVPAPEITSAAPARVEGNAPPGATVRLYRAPATGEGIDSWIGNTRANEEGKWVVLRPVTAGERLVANMDGEKGSSELTEDATSVVAPPAPPVEEDEEEPPVEPPPPPPPPEPPADPPPPPPDTSAPTVVSVAGSEAPANGTREPIQVSKREPIAGEAADPSGIRAVFVALAVPSAKSSAKRRRCGFVHVKRARIVERRCNRPLYFKARGTSAWRLPVSRKTRAILTRARTVTLYLKITDNVGNTGLRKYRFKFGKNSRVAAGSG